MKKIIFIVIFIISISVKSISALDYTEFEFIWSNQKVYIPVGENISNYENLPSAVVIIDGTSRQCTIVAGDTLTWRDTITTTIVGTYYATFEALYTYQNVTISNEATITFIVEDNEAPIITTTKTEITINYGEDIDYSQYIKVEDNSSSIADLTITPLDGHMDTDIIGTYFVDVEISDSYNNATIVSFTIIVVDNVAPIIKHESIIQIEACIDFDIKDYFEGYDEYDNDITSNLTCDDFDSQTLGSKVITVHLYDTSGNYTTKNVTVEVVDNTAPTIELNTLETTLSIDQEYDEEYFHQFVKSVIDGTIELDVTSVVVDLSNIVYEFGVYQVKFSIEDSSGNEGTALMYVTLKYETGPIIYADDITISLGYNFDYKTYVVVDDPYDDDASDNLELVYYGLDINQQGTYQIIVRAYNDSGYFTTKTFLVTVEGSDSVFADKTIYDYWPLGVIVIIFIGYFGYLGYQKIQLKKIN